MTALHTILSHNRKNDYEVAFLVSYVLRILKFQ